MNTSLVQSIRVAGALVLTCRARPALDVGPVPVPQTDQAGLQMTLTTGGYKFNLAAPPFVPSPTAAILPTPVRDSFPASAVVFNRSNNNIVFAFPTAQAAARRFTFRVFDSSGKEIWKSDPDATTTETTNATLQRRGCWRRTGRVPLFLEGKALPVGIYTLEALIDADKQLGATAVFEVVAVPVDTDVGLRALVLRPAEPVIPFSPIPAAVQAANAPVHIVQVGGPTAAIPFEWSGRTDNEGRFSLSTPPGTFRVTIDALPGIDYPRSDPRALTPVALRLPPTLAKTVEIIAAAHFRETQTLVSLM